MMKVKWIFIVIFLVCYGICSAEIIAGDENNYFYQNAITPYGAQQKDPLNDTIDTFSGTLVIRNIDIDLPGPHGMEMRVIRVYSSNQTKNLTSPFGVGWEVNPGKLTNDMTQYKGKYGSYNKIFKMEDGVQKYLIATKAIGLSHGGINVTEYKSYDNWILKVPNTGSALLYSPTGTTYQFDGEGKLIKRFDKFGNYLTFKYITIRSQQYISRIDSSDGRLIKFTYGLYQPKKKDPGFWYLANVRTNDKIWKYTYKGWSAAYLAIVHEPDGTRKWFYNYEQTSDLIQSMQIPTGAIVRYQFNKPERSNGNFYKKIRVSSRKIYSAHNQLISSWHYQYSKGYACNYSQEINYCYMTTVIGPDVIQKYIHGALNTLDPKANSQIWHFGLLLDEQVLDPSSQSVLKQTLYDWKEVSLGGDWFTEVPYGGNIYQSGRIRPDLIKRTIKIGSGTYITQYDDYDEYGHPRMISESNEQQNNSYWHSVNYKNNISDWLIGLPEFEKTNANQDIQITYNDTGDVSARTVNEVTTQYTYHSTGDLASETDPNGNTTRYEQYKLGQPQLITYADGASKTMVVDENGLVTSNKDEGGNSTYYEYDLIRRIKKIAPPTGASIEYQYDNPVGRVGDFMKIQGRYKEIHQVNSLGQEIAVAIYDDGHLLKQKHYRYDAEGRKSFESQWYTSETENGIRLEYDPLGRITKQVMQADGESFVTSYQYPNGHTKIVIDPKGNQTEIVYQALGEPTSNVIQITQAQGKMDEVKSVIRRSHDGRILNVIQGDYTKLYNYNSQNRLSTFSEPETGTTSYEYYSNGALKEQRHNGKDPIHYSYDKRDHLISISYSDQTPTLTKSYDKQGNVIELNQGKTKWLYAYDSNNHLIDSDLTAGNNKFKFHYTYDELGHVKAIRYPDGKDIVLEPNSLGQPTMVGEYASGIQYHSNDLLKQMQYGNGLLMTQSLNARQIPEQIDISNVLRFQYAYDANQNIQSIEDQVEPNNNIQLSYDTLNRLVKADGFGGSGSIRYDVNGNIHSQSIASHDLIYRYDSFNHLQSIEDNGEHKLFQYSTRGEVIFDGRNHLNYNAAGQVIAANDVAYEYDGNQHRTLIHKNDHDVTQIYDRTGLKLYEVAQGKQTKFIYLGRKLVAKDDGAHVTYYHHDVLGSPIVATDSSGKIKWRERYTPYGSEIINHADKISYTGKDKDQETGLNYFGARFYDPLLGRFLSPDVVQFSESNPVSFNRYAYANNNPYSYVDPDGKWAVQAIAFGVGAITGSVIAIHSGESKLNVLKAALVGGGVGMAASIPTSLFSTVTVAAGTSVGGDVALKAWTGHSADITKKSIISAAGWGAASAGAAHIISNFWVPNRNLPAARATQITYTQQTVRQLAREDSEVIDSFSREIRALMVGSSFDLMHGFSSESSNDAHFQSGDSFSSEGGICYSSELSYNFK